MSTGHSSAIIQKLVRISSTNTHNPILIDTRRGDRTCRPPPLAAVTRYPRVPIPPRSLTTCYLIDDERTSVGARTIVNTNSTVIHVLSPHFSNTCALVVDTARPEQFRIHINLKYFGRLVCLRTILRLPERDHIGAWFPAFIQNKSVAVYSKCRMYWLVFIPAHLWVSQ